MRWTDYGLDILTFVITLFSIPPQKELYLRIDSIGAVVDFIGQ